MESRNFFEILEIPPTDNFTLIKDTYKKLAIKYHPDKGGSHEKFVELSNAYELLKDNDFRNLYYKTVASKKYSNNELNTVFFSTNTEVFSAEGTPWVIVGDFSIQKDAVYNDREIMFKHSMNGDRRSFRLCGFSDGSISVTYYNPSQNLFDVCMKERQGYTNFTVKQNITDRWAVGLDKTTDKLKLYEFVTLIDMHDPLNEIKDLACKLLDIPVPRKRINMQQAFLLFTQENPLNTPVNMQNIMSVTNN